MRRFALTLLASLSVVALSACNGYGGSAVGGGSLNNPTRLVFGTPSSGYSSVFKVAPAATTPLVISVYGSQSSLAIQQFDTTATWQTTYAVGTFTINPIGLNSAVGAAQNVTCAAPAATAVNPSAALTVEAAGTTSFVTYQAGTYFQTIGILPTNLTAAAPNTLPAAPYCLNVVATTPGGTQGNVIVQVTN